MNKTLIIIFLTLPVYIFSIFSAASQTRVAFLVGNSDYTHAAPLKNPIRDINLIGDTLSELGFDVSLHNDLNRNELGKELTLFLRQNKSADVTLFYYAGHGMQFEDRNYLVGVDAKLETEFDIESEAVDLERVIQQMKKSSKASLIFIDACRDNPLADEFYKENFSETRAVASRGLAPIKSAYDGTMITFSAAPGQVAFDGGENSPFAASLAKHLKSENVEILSLMKRVIGDVKENSNNKQVPLVSNDLITEIYLNLNTDNAGSSIAFRQEEQLFNAAVALKSPRAWQLYFEKFPNGFFKEIALIEEDRIQVYNLAQLSGLEQWKVNLTAPIDIKPTVAKNAEKALGLNRTLAKQIQESLNDRGYNAGVVDGSIGRGTRKAISEFQQSQGIPATGTVSAATASALGVPVSLARNNQYSSHTAQKYDPKQIELLEDDNRLIHAAKVLEKYRYIYSYYDDRLYIAVLDYGIAWHQANKVAMAVGGHLATINSREENQFLFDLFSQDDQFTYISSGQGHKVGPWIGLFQEPDSSEPRGGWRWVTNEPITFQNWSQGQPNNYAGRQNFAAFHSHGKKEPRLEQRPIEWDDFGGPDLVKSFIIEIE
jgi:peptidoglycan hydrolase-like protein with peptidoglycan-binding domain